MKYTLTLTTLFVALLMLAGCEKIEDTTPDGMVEIFVESMNGNKVVLDGVDAIWKSGDEIRINNATATVERRDGHAYISNAALGETNRALYPASLTATNWGTDNPTITLPAYYHYRTDGNGHQVLDLPMAAYSASSTNPLQFKHLTGALYITVKNESSDTRIVQSVTVTSSNCDLCGALRVDLTSLNTIAPQAANVNSECKSVHMLFDTGYALAANASLRVMIPVLPVDSANRFTIEVKTYKDGENQSYLRSQTQPSGTNHSLARNELGYAPISVGNSDRRTDVLYGEYGRYEIRTANDFALMTKVLNDTNSYNSAIFHLMNDIDMTGFPVTTINNDSFEGTIKGNNHTIYNLTINGIKDANKAYCGLFKLPRPRVVIQNITFDSLKLINQNVGSLPLYVGALGAYNPNSSSVTMTISNCTVNIGNFSDGGASGNVFFGGLIGSLEAGAPLTISSCYVSTPTISIAGSNVWFGGLIGNYGGTYATSISSSSWTGVGTTTITASSYLRMGGLIGQKSKGQLGASNCNISGVIVSESGTNYIGYLIGSYNAQPQATVTNIDASGFSVSVNGSPITVNPFGN